MYFYDKSFVTARDMNEIYEDIKNETVSHDYGTKLVVRLRVRFRIFVFFPQYF